MDEAVSYAARGRIETDTRFQMPYKDKEKQREYARLWIANRRADYFANKVCQSCGSKEQLELHHIDQTQKIEHRIWSWSKERREKELEKCIILCEKCHKAETKKQVEVQWEHGTAYGYRTHGCHCSACKEAHRLYMQDFRKKHLISGM